MQPFAEGRPHSRRAKVAEVVGRGGPVVWDSLAREGEEEALRSEAWPLLLRPLGSDGAVALCEGVHSRPAPCSARTPTTAAEIRRRRGSRACALDECSGFAISPVASLRLWPDALSSFRVRARLLTRVGLLRI